MTSLVSDCPRCNVKKITFDVKGFVTLARVDHGWMHFAEVFSKCRHCAKTATFLVSQREPQHSVIFTPNGHLVEHSALNNVVYVHSYISLRDAATSSPPESVPEGPAAAIQQGVTCASVECWDAAGAMFRKCLDLATKPLLPDAEAAGLNSKVRRDLGLRLPWLFDNGILAADLKTLADCIREDGNDAAHSGALTKHDALDLQEFVVAVLERLFTEPEKLRQAQLRRTERRAG